MNQKKAQLRFYAELNDFLPQKKRQVSFSYSFLGKPSVKNVIQALGVPYVEVDLILANGKSVDFDYRLKQGDMISIYPVFESFDITEVSHLSQSPLRISKFILDVHLGKLAKYLRMLGFDTLYKNDYDDREIVSVSCSEKRIILTRDRNLLKIKEITHGYYVRKTDSKEQLTEILKRFNLHSQIKPLTRCIECNNELIKIDKKEILSQLQPKTILYYEDFYTCTNCSKIYWKGSHYKRMKNFIEKLGVSF